MNRVPRGGRAVGLGMVAFTLVVLGVYIASPVIQSGDSRLVVYEADSIIRERNFELSEYGAIVHGWPCHRERGRILSQYPYGTALTVVPFLALTRAGGALFGTDPTDRLAEQQPRQLEQALASVIVALAALLVVLLTLEVVGRAGPAFAAGLVFAFGTSFWSTASRALWQHGPAVLLGLAALFSLVRARQRGDRRWLVPAGLALGAAFVVRPTWALPLALSGLVLLIVDRRGFAVFGAAAVAAVLPAVLVNLYIYGTLIVPVYLPGEGPVQSGLSNTLAEGLAGTIVSPGRGLFVFTPVLLLGFVGLWLRRGRLGAIDVIAVGSILAIWFSAANTTTWEAGASYGSRYLTDALPFFAYLMAPVFGAVVRPVRTWTPAVTALAVALVLSASWGVFVHARGALSWATQLWNTEPTPAFHLNDRSRLWSWHDPQFFRTGRGSFEIQHPDAAPPAIPPEQICLYG